MVESLTETPAPPRLSLPFFAFEAEERDRERLILDSYQHHVAPFLSRQEVCSLEAARLFAKYAETLAINLDLTKFPWVPVGSIGCLPVIGHLDPLRFEQAAPLPQWFAPRVLLTEAFYLKSMQRLHDVVSHRSNDEWYTTPENHLPRLRPGIEDPLDTLAFLVDYGIFPVDKAERQREQLKQWFEDAVDEHELASALKEDPLFSGFDAALKYLEETQPCIDARQIALDPSVQSSIPQSVAEQNDLLAYLDGLFTTFVLSPYTERFHLGDLIAQRSGSDREFLFVLVSSQHQRPHLAAQEGLRLRQISLEEPDVEFEPEDDAADGASGAEITIKKREIARIDIKASDISNERLVHWILFQAVTIGASDIHIEQLTNGARVRMRVDGALITIHKMSLSNLKGVLAMIKNTCGMNPSHLDTDDNRFTVTLDAKTIDIRVSAVPFRRGYQKIVMRLLDKGEGFKRLDDLCLPERQASVIRHAGKQKQGLILVTGPTGSGKSTTLYAVLDSVNGPETNIHTIEDPIEYELDGLNQTQVNLQRGLTYERVLRSLLRQDPDTIMIGEVRDRETAEAAANAALTGHLVLSTVHSLSSIKAVKRLTQMGVPPYMLSESLILLQAQRLIRKLCDCKQPIEVTPEQAEQFEAHGIEAPKTLHKPAGCPSCLHIGNKGRLAVMELCPVDDNLSEMIAASASTADLQRAAIDHGFRSLFHEALDQCAQGNVAYDVAMELNEAW